MSQAEHPELKIIKLPKKDGEITAATPEVPAEEPRPREVPDVRDPFPYRIPAPNPVEPQKVPAEPAPTKP